MESLETPYSTVTDTDVDYHRDDRDGSDKYHHGNTQLSTCAAPTSTSTSTFYIYILHLHVTSTSTVRATATATDTAIMGVVQ